MYVNSESQEIPLLQIKIKLKIFNVINTLFVSEFEIRRLFLIIRAGKKDIVHYLLTYGLLFLFNEAY